MRVVQSPLTRRTGQLLPFWVEGRVRGEDSSRHPLSTIHHPSSSDPRWPYVLFPCSTRPKPLPRITSSRITWSPLPHTGRVSKPTNGRFGKRSPQELTALP